MATWDDFQKHLDRTNDAIDKTAGALEKMRVSFNSLSETYDGLIDYCKKMEGK